MYFGSESNFLLSIVRLLGFGMLGLEDNKEILNIERNSTKNLSEIPLTW